MTEAV